MIGLLGTFVPALPGPPLSYIGLLLINLSGYGKFSAFFLLGWAGITLIVTVMDYVLPVLLAKKFGGSRAAAIGSLLGLLIGVVFFPPMGMIAGSFLGAMAGELIHNRADGINALKVAMGAFTAFVAGTGAKLIVCGLMLYYAVKTVI